ncbi:hypothetical protein IFM89_023721 [Coptis chinensis]|uniref:Strictosidine synthase conserved region domain-containing protein n=1 Tax=Coptis chinensis TaxID=261450 RepID=A0A835IGU2_9MAGN|nr:hypothetical protein IFM89_023721 [Coptis chinensis]
MENLLSSSSSLSSLRNLALLLIVATSILVLFPLSTVSAYPTTRPIPSSYQYLRLPSGVVGPEAFDFDCNGQGPYTSVSDGRILKWEAGVGRWREFATTVPRYTRSRAFCDGNRDPNRERRCGRPLGLKFNKKTCDLYIADAYLGLMRVGQNGGQATLLASTAGGVPFHFTNNIDIHPETGVVYFTDSSTIFTRKDHLRVTLTGDSTGRLMEYDPVSGKVMVLKSGLKFANGVALSENNDFLLVAETGAARIIRFWLEGTKSNTTEIIAELPGAPDNIKRTANDEFWVAINNGRSIPSYNASEIIGVRLDKEGRILEGLHGNGILESVTELEERNGLFLVGSNVAPFVGVFRI